MAEVSRQKEFLTTTQAAELLSVSPDTVLKWVKAGKIKSIRTLGGHFRIPRTALVLPDSEAAIEISPSLQTLRESAYQYCWEYLARGGEVKPDCLDCITYRSRTRRCYELRDLPEGLGCLRVYCKSNCEQCDYFRMVNDQELNVILLSESGRLIKDWSGEGNTDGLDIRIAENEYECANIVQNFRPDFIVVDCALGKKRTAAVCRNLFNDSRIPVARIILASKTRQLKKYCDKEVCGWITRPFTIRQLKGCIAGAA
jgi:excisionase family DNA binding protein